MFWSGKCSCLFSLVWERQLGEVCEVELDAPLDQMVYLLKPHYARNNCSSAKEGSFWRCVAFGEEWQIGSSHNLAVNGTRYVFHLRHFQQLILVPRPRWLLPSLHLDYSVVRSSLGKMLISSWQNMWIITILKGEPTERISRWNPWNKWISPGKAAECFQTALGRQGGGRWCLMKANLKEAKT